MFCPHAAGSRASARPSAAAMRAHARTVAKNERLLMHAPDVDRTACGDGGWSELDDRNVKVVLGEIVPGAVQFIGIVVRPQPDPITDAFVRQRSLLDVGLPAGECKARLQVLGIGFGSERDRLPARALR